MAAAWQLAASVWRFSGMASLAKAARQLSSAIIGKRHRRKLIVKSGVIGGEIGENVG
jgi:hypothetical protein